MRVSLKWLREYVDIEIPADELAYRLTMAGVEVARIERIGASWDRDKIFVGQITALAPHPNADRLQLATADYGSGVITVVTGAFNLAVGDKVPVALLGARLRNGHSAQHEEVVLKPTKLRGIPSEGMVCSELELGLGEDHEGIMILPADAPVGTPLVDYLGDTIFELEIKGRWDCLSMLGVAQEVAALQRVQYGRQVALREPPLDYPELGDDVNSLISIEIADPDLCPRYSATVVRGVKIGPSPRWLQERVISAGMRPINNVVDITNVIMWETGQPLHAFDYDRIHGKKIIVRRARPGETIVSLDNVTRELTTDMCMIADVDRAVAIGGVMGGLDSEVTEATTTVLLESANFLPSSVRRTARRLLIPSEAQRRFEKGLPAEGTIPAARRATRLILELAGGVAARGVADVWPGKKERHPIVLTLQEVKRLLGMEIPLAEISRVLGGLGCRLEPQGRDAVRVTVPMRRVDLTIPADLVEELARILGYDNMPTTMIAAPIPTEQLSGPELYWEDVVRTTLVGCGYSEVIAYALTNRRTLAKLLPPGADTTSSTLPDSVAYRFLASGVEPLALANPMTAEMDVLRTSALPSLLEILSRNLRHEDRDVAVFEIGRVYRPRGDELPEEARVLTVASGQYRSARGWGQREEVDFFDIKGVAETVLQRMGLRAPGYRISFVPARHPTFHPGRLAMICVERSEGKKGKPAPSGSCDPATVVGLLGEVHPDVLAAFDIAERAYVLGLDLDQLIALAGVPGAPAGGYKPLPRFPAVMQDIAVVVDDGLPAGHVEAVIQRAGGGLVAGVRLFDIYKGDPIPAGKKSLAYSITYQAPDRTLTSDEVAKTHERIEKRLIQELGAAIRK